MSYLFDSCALLNSIRLYGKAMVRFIEENRCCVLTLTYYEVGNALWKESYFLKRLSLDEAAEVLKLVDMLLSRLEIIDVFALRLGIETSTIAFQTGLTFYDASYLLVAKKRSMQLVSDDERLINVSKNVGVKCLRSGDLPIKAS
ncbi:MAG: hypothetical protein DRJ31_06565 [Candidatus Methanomethylicota archaeon]|uniref:PIN domain-containing protein n=1 Tax=Thermoproteota archaeon TaxID=2056631 RepID=A0A497ENH8_9CREN|nr:MAG: hypothetical protein DRJ31_06565 [Candidatus Verstraetearchaeota archaeon]RLE51173.1 MAG: hypothetical protein DRJ33_06390 [Candidatus Verstraetearchaeota archaeon]